MAAKSFTNLVDEGGRELPMNDKVRAQVLGPSFTRQAIINAYIKAMADARTGN